MVWKNKLKIISLVKKRNACYLKSTHQFGIEVPKSVAKDYVLDNTLWADAIYKDMKDVIPDFKKLYNGEIVPIGYQRVNCHMFLDVNMEDFRRKARLVAVRHVTELPSTITYANIVLRDTVMIVLTLDALNDLPVKVADIQNAYITVPVTEKIYTVLGQ